MKQHPEKFFNDTRKDLKCSNAEAYKLTVAEFCDPYYKEFTFCRRGEKYKSTTGKGYFTGPSDSEVRSDDSLQNNNCFPCSILPQNEVHIKTPHAVSQPVEDTVPVQDISLGDDNDEGSANITSETTADLFPTQATQPVFARKSQPLGDATNLPVKSAVTTRRSPGGRGGKQPAAKKGSSGQDSRRSGGSRQGSGAGASSGGGSGGKDGDDKKDGDKVSTHFPSS